MNPRYIGVLFHIFYCYRAEDTEVFVI